MVPEGCRPEDRPDLWLLNSSTAVFCVSVPIIARSLTICFLDLQYVHDRWSLSVFHLILYAFLVVVNALTNVG